MRALVVVALVSMAVQPAEACHRFRVWKYPFPQRCDTRASVPRRVVTASIPVAAIQKPVDDERVDVEITITPELLETWARQDALAKIKGELK